MKKFLLFLKRRPVAIISVIILVLLYLMMIFAEFNAPYSQTKSFSDKIGSLKFIAQLLFVSCKKVFSFSKLKSKLFSIKFTKISGKYFSIKTE